ncbi:MAG TPA: hypothetical protein VLG38_04425, partial [Gammaproteobacteria bacterium]|nr:hypothetical protein [Gammaproteobacteria bacterium]
MPHNKDHESLSKPQAAKQNNNSYTRVSFDSTPDLSLSSPSPHTVERAVSDILIKIGTKIGTKEIRINSAHGAADELIYIGNNILTYRLDERVLIIEYSGEDRIVIKGTSLNATLLHVTTKGRVHIGFNLIRPD